MTGSQIGGAYLAGTTDEGFTAAQLYSTSSYQSGNLTNVKLYNNDLTEWNFSAKNVLEPVLIIRI